MLPCRPADKKVEKTVAEALRKNFEPTRQKSTIEVKFACDGLDKKITRITYEYGAGHGGMVVVRLERADPASPTWKVIGFRDVRGGSHFHDPAYYEALDTQVSSDAVALQLPFLRAALRANVEEVGGDEDSAMGSSSSADVHELVRLEDAEGRALERRFTGYIGSLGQESHVPAEAAIERANQIVANPEWRTNAPLSDEMRQFFEARFVAAIPHFNDDYFWWVRERFVQLSAHVATKALIPALLPLLVLPSTTKKPTASDKRTQDEAIEAVVALTGWEPRAPAPGSAEKPRSNEEVAAELAEQCGKVPVASGKP